MITWWQRCSATAQPLWPHFSPRHFLQGHSRVAQELTLQAKAISPALFCFTTGGTFHPAMTVALYPGTVLLMSPPDFSSLGDLAVFVVECSAIRLMKRWCCSREARGADTSQAEVPGSGKFAATCADEFYIPHLSAVFHPSWALALQPKEPKPAPVSELPREAVCWQGVNAAEQQVAAHLLLQVVPFQRLSSLPSNTSLKAQG